MKNVFLKLFLLALTFLSCKNHNEPEQLFISTYNISVTGDYSIENSSLIHLKNDSLFYFNLDPLLPPYFLSKLKLKNMDSESNELKIEYLYDSLNLYDNDIILHYKLLKEKTTSSVSISSDYFIGKKFMASTKFGNQLIHFMDDKKGRNLTYNYNFEWEITEFEGYYFLLSVSDIERAPLFIKNIASDTIHAQLYTKDEVLEIKFVKID